MSWSVEWLQAALKDLKRLDATVAQRVGRAVDRLAETGEGNVKRLKGNGSVLRLRVGDWPVFLLLDTDAGSLLVLRVLHRGDAYR